jgi:pycsar effector protein
MDSPGKALSTTEEQIEFAWHNFEDQQGIIRAADLKAGYLVTFLLFFGASTIPLGKEVIPKLEWANAAGDLASGLYLVTYLGLVVGFVWSLILISRALTPRIARHHQSPREGSELLYYEHVLRHKDSGQYFEAVSRANPEQLLRNITDQVFELSLICKVKMDSLRAFAVSFKWTVVAWCVSTAIGFWIIGRK